MALWDLKAKLAGEPLWRTLGGRDRFVRGYASGLEIALDDDALVALYERFADRGFSSAKIKGGRDLEHDLRRLAGRARRAAPQPPRGRRMMLDANESWNRSQAIRYLTELETHLDLTWIEEPVRRWDAAGHARDPRRACAPAWPPARTSPGSSSTARCSTPTRSTSCRSATSGASPTTSGSRPSPTPATCR